MEKIYRNGNIFPDEFYIKYTNFNSQKEFIKAAKTLGFEIKLTQKNYKVSERVSTITLDNFIKSNTKFDTWDSFIKNAQSLYEDAPIILPKIFIQNRMAMKGFIARDNYQVQCNICKNKIIIEKGAIIPKCNCSQISSYIILKIL